MTIIILMQSPELQKQCLIVEKKKKFLSQPVLKDNNAGVYKSNYFRNI